MENKAYTREGRPKSTGASSFTDVVNGKWYTEAVVWANQKDIVGGYGNGLFGPDDPHYPQIACRHALAVCG